MNKQTESKAAQRGHKMHGLMESHGSLVKHHPEFDLLDDDEQARHLIMVADYLASFDARAKSEGWKVYTELELDLRYYQLHECEFGTADRVDVLDSVAELFDFKFGRWAVTDAEQNIQMWLYVLGVFARFKTVDLVNVHILQPALDVVSTASFTRSDIDRLWLRASTIAERRRQLAGVEFTPVASNCLWCDRKAECKAMHAMALAVKKSFPMETLDVGLHPDDLTEEKLLDHGAAIYDMTKLVEDWATQTRKKITSMVDSGCEIRGKRVSQSGGKSSVLFPKQAVEIAAEMAGRQYAEVLEEVMTVTVGKLDAVVGSAAPSGKKGAYVDDFRGQLRQRGLIYSSPPTRFLVDVKA